MSTNAEKRELAKNEIEVIKSASLHPDYIDKRWGEEVLDYTSGLIIGSYSNHENFYWGIALNGNKEVLAGHGITSKETDTGQVFKKEKSHYVYFTFAQKIWPDKEVKPTIKECFAVNKEQMEELHIDSMDSIRQLCLFSATCYKTAPSVIDQMREGDFTQYKKYQENQMMIEMLKMDNVDTPITFELKI